MKQYWDIGDFLCEDEKVMGRFRCESFQNGELSDTLQQSADLTEGQVLELPLWLAIKLAQGKFVQIEVPPIYRENFKNTLKADPCVVNLREKNGYYYETGNKLIEYIDDPTLVETLLEVSPSLDFHPARAPLRKAELPLKNRESEFVNE